MLFIGAIGHFLAAAILAMVINWLGLMPWRRAAGAHWTERARLLWRVRRTASWNVLLISIFLAELHQIFYPQTDLMWLVNLFVGYAGALLGGYPLQREVYGRLTFLSWIHQVTGWMGIWLAFIIPFLTAMILMPDHFDWQLLLVAAGYILLHLWFQWGVVLKYLQLVRFMKPAGPRLQQIVDAMTSQMDVKVRATWQFGGSLANAFAYPMTRQLAFGNRLLEVCTDEEVSAICAHELAHLKESKMVLAGRLVASFCLFPFIFIAPATLYWGVGGIALLVMVFFLIAFFSKRLSRRQEESADALARQQQANAGVYARALEKLYQANQMPAVMPRNNRIHPHLYDRMLAAGITPDYPRPARPQTISSIGLILIILTGIMTAWVIALNFK